MKSFRRLRSFRGKIYNEVLGKIDSDRYRDMGQLALALIEQKWERCRVKVPSVSEFVDESLVTLKQQVQSFRAPAAWLHIMTSAMRIG